MDSYQPTLPRESSLLIIRGLAVDIMLRTYGYVSDTANI